MPYAYITDSRFAPMVLTTYPSFTTPRKLFHKLRERYYVPASAGLPLYAHRSPLCDIVSCFVELSNVECDRERVERIQFRVCVVLKHWLERQLFDFDQDLIAELSVFIDELSHHSNKVRTMSISLLSHASLPVVSADNSFHR